MSDENETTSAPVGQMEAMPPNAPSVGSSAIIDLPVEQLCDGKLQGRRRRRLKPVRISDALRKEGLDEREIAKLLRLIIERQLKKDWEKSFFRVELRPGVKRVAEARARERKRKS